MPTPGARSAYQGIVASGYRRIGGNVTISFDYALTAAKAIFNSMQSATGSVIVPGAQLPNVPLHQGSAMLTAGMPSRSIYALFRTTFVGRNNPRNLPGYLLSDAGIATKVRSVTLTLFERNLFDQHAGIFTTANGSVPLATTSGREFDTFA